MVRITKVTTKKGDKGSTNLAGGQRVSKSSLRIEAYGSVDELNAYLGMIRELLRQEVRFSSLGKKILRIQNELFNLGSQLAVLTEDRRQNTPVIKDDDIIRLETEIKEKNSQLPTLKSFVLPGGNSFSSHLQIANTICRRAERNVVRLFEQEKPDGTELPYLNRLSDWLFVAARHVSKILGKDENLWGQDEPNS